jgi:hypothetical protein
MDLGQVLSIFVALLIGAAVPLLSADLTARRQLEREREHRTSEREAATLARRDAFQRETLLELQEVLAKLGRHANEAWLSDLGYFKRGRMPGFISDELNRGIDDCNRDMTRLKVRVLDDHIREMVQRFHDQSTRLLFRPRLVYRDTEEAGAAIDDGEERSSELSGTFTEVNELIGTALRRLF